jgi:hypothetical protein
MAVERVVLAGWLVAPLMWVVSQVAVVFRVLILREVVARRVLQSLMVHQRREVMELMEIVNYVVRVAVEVVQEQGVLVRVREQMEVMVGRVEVAEVEADVLRERQLVVVRVVREVVER